ncbi:Hypothetical protein D9617_11g010100 [Elsinoe fawcettii]|nr:Hypothetical protein D9617_11g010100 [Elsinoe fawcettii]
MAQPPTAPASPSANVLEHHASYLPRDIPYSPIFEDAISSLLISPPSNAPSGTSSPPSSLPNIDLSALPLPPSDSRRKYPSPIPGLLLTHPGGYLEGGPGLSPQEDEFAAHFISEHGIRDSDTLARIVDREIEAQLDIARQRARSRQEAQRKNEGIEAEIRAMEEQLRVEMRVLGKARQMAKEKRERRERRRAGR